MALLRRILYFHALVWAVGGMALAGLPGVLVVGLFGQHPPIEDAWIRLAGVQGLGLSMFMVLVGHRADELWWWAWGFVIATGAAAAVLTLNAAFGVPSGASAVMWWALALLGWALASGLVVGIARAAQERPPY